jgi:MFS family permease
MSSIPTRVRTGVLLLLCLLSFILYLDRICMGQATPYIKAELELSNTLMGVIAAAFTIAYGLFEVPTGRWGDRYGSRGVLIRIVLWWSTFTALTGAAIGGASLFIVRFLFGAGEAGALPNSARVISRWFPIHERGPAQGMVTMSALIGAVGSPVVAEQLIQCCGWRWTFVIFGTVGVAWVVAFARWFRDRPAEHPGVSKAELEYITGSVRDPHEPQNHPAVPWDLVLRSPNVWLLGFTTTCSAFASYLYYTWYPIYLKEARELPTGAVSWLTSLVLAGGAVGCLVGGYLGRWAIQRTGERRWSRRALGAGGLTIAAASLSASVHATAPLSAALWATLASFTASITLTAWWAVVTDITGQHLGVLFGLMNSMGVIGAIGSQLFFGWLSDVLQRAGFEGRARYDPAFYVYSAVLLAGAIGWLFIDSTRSVVEESTEKSSQHIRRDLRDAVIDKDGTCPADGAG